MKQDIKKQLLNRLARLEGQVRGLKNMVENEEYCVDIITQSHAVRSSLGSFESLMLKNHLETHVLEQIKTGEDKKACEEIIKIYNLSNKK
ncbi:MAG: metal-sensitive transcriptional regulator [Candidatus Paceibacterota bacterium]